MLVQSSSRCCDIRNLFSHWRGLLRTGSKDLPADIRDIFSDIYRRRAWGGEESVSGPGSGVGRTAAFRSELLALLKDLHTRTLLDAACGDFNWMKEMSLDLEGYLGIDIVAPLIDDVRRRYADTRRNFIIADITKDGLPRMDLILCRDCLVHFSFADAFAAIRNFKASRSKYLLTTTFTRFGENADIRTGEWRQLSFEIAPFNFPKPLRTIDEKCTHSGGIFADKHLALWELADLLPERPQR